MDWFSSKNSRDMSLVWIHGVNMSCSRTSRHHHIFSCSLWLKHKADCIFFCRRKESAFGIIEHRVYSPLLHTYYTHHIAWINILEDCASSWRWRWEGTLTSIHTESVEIWEIKFCAAPALSRTKYCWPYVCVDVKCLCVQSMMLCHDMILFVSSMFVLLSTFPRREESCRDGALRIAQHQTPKYMCVYDDGGSENVFLPTHICASCSSYMSSSVWWQIAR